MFQFMSRLFLWMHILHSLIFLDSVCYLMSSESFWIHIFHPRTFLCITCLYIGISILIITGETTLAIMSFLLTSTSWPRRCGIWGVWCTNMEMHNSLNTYSPCLFFISSTYLEDRGVTSLTFTVRLPHPNICLVLLYLLPPLCNFSNREYLGWLVGWEQLSIVVVI